MIKDGKVLLQNSAVTVVSYRGKEVQIKTDKKNLGQKYVNIDFLKEKTAQTSTSAKDETKEKTEIVKKEAQSFKTNKK